MNPRLPILTLLLGLTGIAVAMSPDLAERLICRRAEVLAGDYWRLFTGHLVHVSGSHLIGNLALVVVAGGLLERRSRRVWRVTVGLAVLAIGPLLFVIVPEMESYAGLSGVAAGLLVALCLVNLELSTSSRWTWLVILGLLVAKIGFELFDPTPLIAASDGYRSVPVAHIVGAIAGLFAFRLERVRTGSGQFAWTAASSLLRRATTSG